MAELKVTTDIVAAATELYRYNYVYLITNLVNGKIYVGKHSTNDINDGYMGSGTLLIKAKKKYAKENFVKVILAFADTKRKLDYLEKYYIRKFNSTNKRIGYNISSGGDGLLGVSFSDEHKDKIRKALMGNKNSVGRHLSDETKRKISEVKIGFRHTEEAKQKMRDALIGKRTGEKNPMYGVHRFGKDCPAYGVKQKKYKYVSPDGVVKEMRKSTANRYYKDWRLLDD